MTNTLQVVVINRKTGEIVERLDARDLHEAELLERGLRRNMNRRDYRTGLRIVKPE